MTVSKSAWVRARLETRRLRRALRRAASSRCTVPGSARVEEGMTGQPLYRAIHYPTSPMRLLLAWRNLTHDRAKTFVILMGVVFSVVLICMQGGMYLGFMRNASTLIDHTDADIWVTSKNSQNFDFSL